MTISLDGRVAVVTGAGNGLGRCHALALAARGAKVVVNDLGGDVAGTGGSSRAADRVVAEIAAAGGTAVANHDNVATEAGGQGVVQTALDAFGTVDIVINNAGILRDKAFHNMAPEDCRAVVDVHLMGSLYVTRAAWPVMRDKGYGRVVMTTSAAGLYGNFGQANYAAAKMGLVGLALTLAQEGAKYGIASNAIAPVAETRLAEGIFPPDVAAFIVPDHVTPVVLYLVSRDCTLNGTVLTAGGGHIAQARVVESAGVQFDPAADLTPEQVAEALDQATDMAAAQPYDHAFAAIGKMFEAIRSKVR